VSPPPHIPIAERGLFVAMVTVLVASIAIIWRLVA